MTYDNQRHFLIKDPEIITINFRDAILVAMTNCGTSVFAAIIIFAIMGFKVFCEHCNSDFEIFIDI